MPLDQRTFLNTSLQGLVGFDLNTNSTFTSFSTLPFLVQTLDGNKIVLQHEAFLASDCFIFPEYTTEATLEFSLLHLALPSDSNTITETFSIHFTQTKEF